MSDWIWGADIGLDSTAICALRSGADPQLIAPRAGKGTIPERLDRLMADTELLAGQLCSECPPLMVLVERPTGKFPNPHLGYATAAVILALHRALKDRFPYPVSVVLVTIGDWKKVVLGKGNATKDEVMEWAVQSYPHLDGITQDEADALAIASYGLESVGVPS